MVLEQKSVFSIDFINTLQDQLKSNNSIHDYENIFWQSAREIMNNYKLRVEINTKVSEYFLTELEYYFFDSQYHPDPYVHKHCLQLKSGEFYIHEMGLNRSGIDITFGNSQYFGGILIRGIQNCINETFYPGPANSLNELIKEFNDAQKLTYHDVQLNSKVFSLVKIINESPLEILRSTRVGINKSFCDPKYEYLTGLYRFVRKDYYEKTSIPEKTKIRMCSHPIIDAKSQTTTINEWKNMTVGDPLNILWNKVESNFQKM